MNKLEKNLKILSRLTWLCIIIGLIEVFVLIFFSSSIFAIIPGLITIIPAYISLIDEKIKWKYFVGVWALIKYNPISVALTSFIIADLTNGAFYNKQSLIFFLLGIFMTIIGICSIVIAIFIIILTAKQIKLLKSEFSNKD